ncbi:SAM-dependent methyltransferase, partial [Vibrio cholerae HC-39A1]
MAATVLIRQPIAAGF